MALAAVAEATGAPQRTSGTLDINTTLRSTRTSSANFCPPGTPETSVCARYVAEGRIRGLGRVTSSYTKIINIGDPDCEVLLLNPAYIEVAGKGAFELSTAGRICWRFQLPITVGPFELIVTGASGRYAGASGSLMFTSSVFDRPPGSMDTWTGTLAVPGIEFDLTPPVLTGVRNLIVRAPKKKAKRARVRYSVTAQDAVDGSVRAACTPGSGSFFKLGRTKVTCSANDSSENSATASFRVTVKRRR